MCSWHVWNHVMLRYRRLEDGTLMALPRYLHETNGLPLEFVSAMLPGQMHRLRAAGR